MRYSSHQQGNQKVKRPDNIGGRIWMILMGLLLVAMGAIFMSYLWNAYQRAKLMDSWVETPCRIVSATLDDSQQNQHYATKYRIDLRYEYEFEGKSYTGTQLKRLPSESADAKKLKKKMAPYPEGTTSTCFVNPDSPEMAVLKKDSKAALYSIWFPALFSVGGLGIIVSTLRPPKNR